MGFQFQWGTYVSQVAEAGIAITREDITSEATGLLIGIKERWSINGFLQAADPIALAVLTSALELAFSVNYMPATLLFSGATLRFMSPITPLGGTRVISSPSYPFDGSADAEFSTYRRYRVEIEGRFVVPAAAAAQAQTLAWHETIQQIGTGGGRFVFRQPLTGFPQKQPVSQATTVRVIQRGSAVGLSGWIPVPDPIWPEAEHEDQREIEYGTPQRTGSVYLEWPSSWTYVFEDINPSGVFQPTPFSGA